MQIRSLLDRPTTQGRDNVSLARFVALFEKDHGALHANLTPLLDDILSHCEDIEKWGNRRFGHADRLTVLGHETLPEVSQQHFEKAQAMMCDLLRAVHGYFNGPGVHMELPVLFDGADELLSYIRDGRQAKLAEIEEQL
jgi:hypothetical protein